MKHLNYMIAAILVCAAIYIGVFIGRNTMPNTIHIASIRQEKQEDAIQRIDINTATLDELRTLPGIGKYLAGEIIEYREKYGNYIHIAELREVPGMTADILENIKEYITVD